MSTSNLSPARLAEIQGRLANPVTVIAEQFPSLLCDAFGADSPFGGAVAAVRRVCMRDVEGIAVVLTHDDYTDLLTACTAKDGEIDRLTADAKAAEDDWAEVSASIDTTLAATGLDMDAAADHVEHRVRDVVQAQEREIERLRANNARMHRAATAVIEAWEAAQVGAGFYSFDLFKTLRASLTPETPADG